MLLDQIRHVRTECISKGEPWFPRALSLVKTIALRADTTIIRIILANASLLWAAFALFDQRAFERHAYSLMAAIAPMPVWAVGFLAHFFGVYWRLFDRVSRPRWALAVNTYGFLIWFTSSAAMTLAAGRPSPAAALEWTMCAASAWALFRTGLNREIVSP